LEIYLKKNLKVSLTFQRGIWMKFMRRLVRTWTNWRRLLNVTSVELWAWSAVVVVVRRLTIAQLNARKKLGLHI
jgi:hypothetical protein